MALRTFQNQLIRLRNRMLEGDIPLENIYLDVTPGGGKSLSAIIIAQLIPKLADKICWVVPRTSLARQAEKVFVDRQLRMLLNHALSIRYNHDNTPDPSRGLHGYVSTYQAVAANSSLHAQEFSRYRYILFLDEPHHLPLVDDRAWVRALSPLVDRSVLCVYASGTFERHDGQPIAFLPYQNVRKGLALDFPTDGRTIRYSRKEALTEKVIVPLTFRMIDGTAHWVDATGNEVRLESFDIADPDQHRAALDTALKTEFAKKILHEGAETWKAYKKQYPWAKLLIVSPTQPCAREYAKYLKDMCGIDNLIATSDEGKDSQENIARFKGEQSPSVDVLVTVAMAYEGLDVPNVTHLVCLSAYRSKPWIEQCFARTNRVPKHREKERGYIFTPDDIPMRNIITLIMEDEDHVAHLPLEGIDLGGDGSVEIEGIERHHIIPLASDATQHRVLDLDGEFMGRTETARIDKILKAIGAYGLLTPLQFRRGADLYYRKDTHEENDISTSNDITPSEMESRLRKAIEHHCRAVDVQEFESNFGTANALVRDQFRRSRTEMSCDELKRVWEWLEVHYPLRPQEGTPQ